MKKLYWVDKDGYIVGSTVKFGALNLALHVIFRVGSNIQFGTLDASLGPSATSKTPFFRPDDAVHFLGL